MDIHRIAIFFADNIFQVVIQLVLECVFKALTQAYNRRKKLKQFSYPLLEQRIAD